MRVMSRSAATRAALLALVVVAVGCTRGSGGSTRPPGPSVPSRSAAPSSGIAPDAPTEATADRSAPQDKASPADTVAPAPTSWVYQLQGYHHGRLDALARAPHGLVVIDLARDAGADFFGAQEIAALHASGKKVLAYFEIGSIEDFRPEYTPLRRQAGDLILNRWDEWPSEYFVRYWDRRWWDRVIQPRVDQALDARFDGVYLDTPLAYEELDLSRAPGQTRHSLARAMVNLIVRISDYAKLRRPGFWVVPQNSPELRSYPGYTEAIDGIGIEELFFQATDRPCTEDYCAENLANVRALRDAGKPVFAVDYATRPANIRVACAQYQKERFVGYVGVLELDRISPSCS
jgi:cysteinyl-tRNA synthetase, unknown class